MPKNTYEDSRGAVFESQQEAAASNTSLGTNPMTINSSVLQNTKPIKIEAPPSTPTTSGLALTTGGIISQLKTDATAEPFMPANPQKDQLSQMLSDISGGINTQASDEAQFARDEQLYQKKQKATAVSTQLDQMDKDYRDEVAAINKNPGGKSARGLQVEVNEATDRYQNNRANVALTYKVLAGDYNDAAQIVNDKVNSLRAQHTQQLQAYQLAADAIMNDLSASERLIVQEHIATKQRNAEQLQTAYSDVLENAVQNAAPASVLSAIDSASRIPGATAASIQAAAGRYGIPLAAQIQQAQIAQLPLEAAYKKAQIANIYSEIDARKNAATAGGTATLTGKPQTQAQVLAQGFADRTQQADKIITAVGSEFTGVESYLGGIMPNFLKSSTRQQYEQAQRNFVNAVLRRESGAVISNEEFANARQQYFPQPGDTLEVTAQKAQNRNTVINNLYQSGNTYRPATAGSVIEAADGKQYMVGEDGETLIAI